MIPLPIRPATYGRIWPPVKRSRRKVSVFQAEREPFSGICHESAAPLLLILAHHSHAKLKPMPQADPAQQRTPSAVHRLSIPGALLISLIVVAIAAGILYAMGRIPMCKCGTIKLWHPGRGDSEVSQHLADWYTYSHVLHGIIFYWLLSVVAKGRLSVAARLVIAMGIEAAWEIFENTPFIINRYRAQTISRDYFGDSVVNSVADMVAMLVGFLIAYRLPAWVTVCLLIATEVILLLLIRDNLILNIVMLIHPVAWIKQWQLGG
jgi:Protein of unknown function (DUF2585)